MAKGMRNMHYCVEAAPAPLVSRSRTSNCPKLETIIEEGSESYDGLQRRERGINDELMINDKLIEIAAQNIKYAMPAQNIGKDSLVKPPPKSIAPDPNNRLLELGLSHPLEEQT
ncbi:LOW QUALITY PROTEIN: hypothetical protein RJ641_001791 [Dillenia turbinata]|uniref:Uncharacterized protein n=1 Tax=Dillenia turbinata TaxID=194707 RepID=A0AAN8VMF1_9MAGN